MKLFRSSLRFIGFGFLATGFIVTAQAIRLSHRDLNERRKALCSLISKYSRRTLAMMGVRVYVKDLSDAKPFRPALIACNHMSYLDVLILAARHPGAFVTSVEVRETPFLGLLSELGGCLYVERRSREGLSKEVADLTGALKSGLDVLFFPEATSTNGEEILRFRRPLFQAAIDADTPVWPMTLNYYSIDDEDFTQANRDKVCWYGKMPFLSHLLTLFAQREVTALLTQHPQIEVNERDNSQLAEMTHLFVKSRFHGCRPKRDFTADINNSFSAARTFVSMDSTVSPS